MVEILALEFLFQRKGGFYYVLTAAHVVESVDEYDIVTSDRVHHRLEAYDYSLRVSSFSGSDLALVQFESNRDYPIGEVSLKATPDGEAVYIAGFPKGDDHIRISEGFLLSSDFVSRPLKDGYGLIYNVPTVDGMSGGGIFNKDGKLIGIHGRAEKDGQNKKTGFNLGLPIQNFLNF